MVTIPQSIKYLSAWLHRAYGKPPYILLDEYDTPLHSAHLDKYYDQMITFIRSFMVQTFKGQPPPEAGCAHRHTENCPGEHLQRLQQSQSLHYPFPGHEGLLWIYRTGT